MLIVNADDWGRDVETTDRIAQCAASGAVSSASAMVFMEDSERAAFIARDRGLETGLHVNFTTPFSAPRSSGRLVVGQARIGRYLSRHRLAQTIFHPGLVPSFEYVVCAQLDEFERLYGAHPERLDGHHHMHLCANMLIQRLLPPGTVIRRNFSFLPGEKSLLNRVYRRAIDARLAKHHRLTDYFFSLEPLEPPERVERIFALARTATVELEAHPVREVERRFLLDGELRRLARDVCLVPPSVLLRRGIGASA